MIKTVLTAISIIISTSIFTPAFAQSFAGTESEAELLHTYSVSQLEIELMYAQQMAMGFDCDIEFTGEFECTQIDRLRDTYISRGTNALIRLTTENPTEDVEAAVARAVLATMSLKNFNTIY